MFLVLKLVVIDWSRITFSASIVLTDFGALYGLDVPFLLLGLIGLAALWNRTPLNLNLAAMLVVVLAFFNESLIMFSLVFVAYYGGRLVAFLLNREWVLSAMKLVTLLLIGCTVLFSFIVYATYLGDTSPSNDLVKAIGKIPPDSDIVLSDFRYYPFIRYYAQKRTYSGGFADDIFMSRDLKLTEDLLNETGVDVFFITGDMQKGSVWKRSGEGLMFLLPHSQRFVLRYSYQPREESFQVWAYRPSFEKIS